MLDTKHALFETAAEELNRFSEIFKIALLTFSQ